MSLLLTGSPDQALLVMVVKQANHLNPPNAMLGRTTIQKLMYFLSVTGVPMRYKFDIHHYGPYCDDISRDVEWLCADGVLRDEAQTSNYSKYVLGPQAQAILSKWEKNIRPVESKIRRIVSTLLPLGIKNQELVATLHYLYRQLRVLKKKGGPSEKAVIEQFMQLKGERFTKEEVSKTYNAMVSAGLVGA